ncbi:T9SS type A sorting domain-containing protein [Niastella caeni]|uniref:T9SS type A sorting domain-containing protein n=1 Tax=Niastella caeni TaxID=2569763 RepID=A0A4S8HYN8_9BACT|nr:peptide-N-glycosidase F-related protein [Niastella caeni]THU39284.1 T9SS type A sorting domain-containing protein [Niastella caeni]
MRYFVRACVLYLLLVSLFSAKGLANPGDTTWVQAQNDVQLDYYNDFDAAVTFPSGTVSYRKIIMVFTLGKYQCPAGTQYCGDWDYTVQNYLMTPTDTFELSRLITPYANASYPRTGWNWKQRYYFDVTDFYPVLKNAATIRLSYHNYSGGFTGNIKFAFIEGTPPRSVTGIKRLWHGAFPFGRSTDPIENYLPAINALAPANTQQAEMNFTVTGHGSDNTGCSEFCSKYYQVYANSSLKETKTIWKDNCGSNNLYPQSGTWIYNRAGWCPGEQVNPNVHKLGAVTAGNSINADVNFQSYTGNGSASYIIESALFFYGAYNQNLDASVESIIAPNDYEGHFRANPICGNPVVVIKNTGATTINSVALQYGVAGQTLQTYTVSGLTIASSKDTTIKLPSLSALATLAAGSINKFVVTIQQINGNADGYALNNSMQSSFVAAPEWPGRFTMVIKSNNGATQTKWRIEDLNSTVYKQRNPTATQTVYTDSVELPDGCYRLVVTDANCDGLYWWANSGAGRGYVYAAKKDGTVIPFTNGLPAYPASLAPDFGCGFTQYFRVSSTLAADQLLLSGEAKEANNLLSWETSKEVNTERFALEYSVNDTTYTAVAEVKANGNTSSKSTYSSTHIPTVHSAFYYYRLKLYYTDGSWKYSNKVTLSPVASSEFAVDVRPSPFNDEIKVRITAPRSQTASITLFDMQGRILLNRNSNLSTGLNVISIDGNSFAAGVYTIVIRSDGQKLARKIIKL